jgi:cysteine desulfurase
MARIYLDHNATTPIDPRVRAAMARVLDEDFGNPSSVHAEGRRARQAIEAARAEIARLVSAASDDVILTSGGTEADQLGVRALAAIARARDPARRRVVTTRLEHPAVLGAVEQLAASGAIDVTLVAPEPDGRVDPERVAAALGPDVALVAMMVANHEVGTLLPVAEVARAARAVGALVHADLVQAAGKIALDVGALDVDAAALSAHKLGGPKGAGALVVRRGLVVPPLLGGGHQERERRPGTENVPGIVGFGEAARLARVEGLAAAPQVAALAARLEAGLVALGARIHGAGAERVGNTVSAAFPGCPGDLVVESLDLAGVAASTGAACTSGRRAPSTVLLAMGLDRARAAEAVRFSLGRSTTAAEIDALLALLPAIIARVRAAVSD